MDLPKTGEEKFLPKEPENLPRPELEIPVPVSQATSAQKQNPIHPTQQHAQPKFYPLNQVKTLLAWTAPGRPFREKGKEYYISVLLITMLVEIILFLFSEYALMLVVISIAFVSFALATVPPHDFAYRISTEGLTIEDHFYLWQELYDFYFKQRGKVTVLHVRTKAYFPGELTITLGSLDKQHVLSVLLPYLPFREVVYQTFMEKSGDWLARSFPLERLSS